MKQKFLIRNSDGKPFEFVEQSKRRGHAIIREMSVMKVTKGLFDCLIHPWGTIDEDIAGQEWQISSDVRNELQEVKNIKNTILAIDEKENIYTYTDKPKTKA
jgi:hypothetical protein